ncbi:unnamed protein product [Sphacelaria rigidula]
MRISQVRARLADFSVQAASLARGHSQACSAAAQPPSEAPAPSSLQADGDIESAHGKTRGLEDKSSLPTTSSAAAAAAAAKAKSLLEGLASSAAVAQGEATEAITTAGDALVADSEAVNSDVGGDVVASDDGHGDCDDRESAVEDGASSSVTVRQDDGVAGGDVSGIAGCDGDDGVHNHKSVSDDVGESVRHGGNTDSDEDIRGGSAGYAESGGDEETTDTPQTDARGDALPSNPENRDEEDAADACLRDGDASNENREDETSKAVGEASGDEEAADPLPIDGRGDALPSNSNIWDEEDATDTCLRDGDASIGNQEGGVLEALEEALGSSPGRGDTLVDDDDKSKSDAKVTLDDEGLDKAYSDLALENEDDTGED